MFKSFFRRWLILNTLYHLCSKTNLIWVNEDDFIDYSIGNSLKSSNSPAWLYKDVSIIGNFRKWLIFKFLNSKDNLVYQKSELRNVISECDEKYYIKYTNNETEIMLSTLGMDIYSVSYLIFGHDYAKKIWTGILVGLVVWWTSYRIENIEPQIIYVNEQSTIEISQTAL